MKYKVESKMLGNVELKTQTRKELRTTLRNLGFKGSHLTGGDVFFLGKNHTTVTKIVKVN